VGLHCCNQAHQWGTPVLVDGSSLLEGEDLIALGMGPGKGSHLIEQATEAHSRGAVFEPAHRPIPLFDPAMILLNGLITHDKFRMSRISPSRVRWVRRVPLRRAPPAITIYLTPQPLGADRWIFSGSLDQLKADIERVRDLGAHELFFDPTFSPHTCPLKPRSAGIAVLRGLTLRLPHALLALHRNIRKTRREGSAWRERP
jgi:hypothetical protein